MLRHWLISSNFTLLPLYLISISYDISILWLGIFSDLIWFDFLLYKILMNRSESFAKYLLLSNEIL